MCRYVYIVHIHIVSECISRRPASVTLWPLPAATIVPLGAATVAATVRHRLKALRVGRPATFQQDCAGMQHRCLRGSIHQYTSCQFETAPLCDSGPRRFSSTSVASADGDCVGRPG